MIAQFPLLLWSQLILIDKTNSNYIINDQTLSAKGKTCRVINCLSKNYADGGASSVRPFVLFKVFDYTAKIPLAKKPENAIYIDDYIKTTVVPQLEADMYIRIDDFAVANRNSSQLLDSLILYDGKTYQLLNGVIVSELFNVTGFKQLNVLQTNQTLINIEATIVQTSIQTKDSIAIAKTGKGSTFGKMFLRKKNGNDFTFFREPFFCRDCFFDFNNEYVYRKEFGIIAFKSKYIYRTSGYAKVEGDFATSTEYYYYR